MFCPADGPVCACSLAFLVQCPCNYPDNYASNKRWCCGDTYHLDMSVWAYEKVRAGLATGCGLITLLLCCVQQQSGWMYPVCGRCDAAVNYSSASCARLHTVAGSLPAAPSKKLRPAHPCAGSAAVPDPPACQNVQPARTLWNAHTCGMHAHCGMHADCCAHCPPPLLPTALLLRSSPTSSGV